MSRLNLTYACCTEAGLSDGRRKQSQDAWVVKEHVGGTQRVLLGVFDGHGEDGRGVADVVAMAMPKVVAAALETVSEAELLEPTVSASVLTHAFGECSRLLPRIGALDLCLSGSTGVVAMLDAHRLVVANLGDSKCVLGRVDSGGTGGGRGGAVAVEMTNEHTPGLVAEAARVLSCGGRIAPYTLHGRPVGSLRVWLADHNVPGLSMTRCFGDAIAASVGVSDVPEVVEYALAPGDRYLILMSDGVSQFMGSSEIVEFVHHLASKRQMRPNKVAVELVREARERWAKHHNGSADDCTCIVVFLEPLQHVGAARKGARRGRMAAARACWRWLTN